MNKRKVTVQKRPLAAVIPDEEGSRNVVSPETRKPENQEKGKPGRQEEGAVTSKVKVTYEFSEDTVDGLEEARIKLRKILGRRASRYEIVEAALQIAIEELDNRGSESQLALKL